MKKIIKKFLLFLTPLFAITLAIDLYISKDLKYVYDHAWGETETWNAIFDHQIKDSCLIYGSSRASSHINPTIIEEKSGKTTFNFGQPSQMFDLQIVRHNINVKNNGYPHYIIHSLDPRTFVETTILRNKTQFVPYMLWNENLRSELRKYNDYTLVDYYVPLARYFAENVVLSKLAKYWSDGKHSESKLTKGFETFEKEWIADFDFEDTDELKKRINVDPAMISLYDDFLQECKDNNVRIALVCTPEEIHSQMLASNRDSIIDVYKQIGEKHNLLFLDYSKDSLSYDTHYFFNSTHLNKKGTTIFSERLADDLIKSKFFN